MRSICIYVYRKYAHYIWAFDQDNNDLHSQIKSSHRTIGMRISTIYFPLEAWGRQAYTKKSGSKERKGKRRKARFFLTRLLTYYLFTYWLTALLSLVFIERSNLDLVDVCNLKLTTVGNERKSQTRKQVWFLRIVNVLDTYQEIIYNLLWGYPIEMDFTRSLKHGFC